MVIQACPAQFFVIQFKSQGLDQMQLHAGICAEPDDIPSVGGNFRLKQNDMKHAQSLILTGVSFQISLLYSVMVLSVENLPLPAQFKMLILVQFS